MVYFPPNNRPLGAGIDQVATNRITPAEDHPCPADEKLFLGVCGLLSSDWIVLRPEHEPERGTPDPNPAKSCPLDGATIDEDCMTCPGEVFLHSGPCGEVHPTCSGNTDFAQYPDVICEQKPYMSNNHLNALKPGSDQIFARTPECCCTYVERTAHLAPAFLARKLSLLRPPSHRLRPFAISRCLWRPAHLRDGLRLQLLTDN